MLYQLYEAQRSLMEPFADFAQAASKLFGAGTGFSQMPMAQRGMPHQQMMSGSMMQNCQSMQQQMMSEMRSLRQDMAELRAEMRRQRK